MARILVTGAAGFIGSHVVEALLAHGHHITGVDSFDAYYDPAWKHRNAADLRAHPAAARLSLHALDILDPAALAAVWRDARPEGVVHLAALPGGRVSAERPQAHAQVNLVGTLGVLELMRALGPDRLVLASTSSVYGDAAQRPFVETDAADRPLSPYAASKRAAELMAHTYHHLHGLQVTTLRFFTVYGPRNRPDMLAFQVLDRLHRGQEITLFEGGALWRDWTYVGDTVAGIVAAAERPLGYEIINLGRGEPVRVLEFVRELERQVGKPARWVESPRATSDAAATHADITKARRLLGYDPKVPLDEGLRALCAWYRGLRR
jgi:UDP-glucuronate 4-epimerase